MGESEIYYSGTLRIRNPKTLQKWIDNGKYQKEIDKGWIFNVGCGRFREKKCDCSKCRKSTNSPLLAILKLNNISLLYG